MCSRDRLIIDAYFNDVISKNSNDLHDLWNLTTQPSLATSNSSLVLLGKQEEQRLALSFTQIPNLVAAQLALSVLSEGQRGSSCGVSSSSVPFQQITFNDTSNSQSLPGTAFFLVIIHLRFCRASIEDCFEPFLEVPHLWMRTRRRETTSLGQKLLEFPQRNWNPQHQKMGAKHEKTCTSDFNFQKWAATWKLLNLMRSHPTQA